MPEFTYFTRPPKPPPQHWVWGDTLSYVCVCVDGTAVIILCKTSARHCRLEAFGIFFASLHFVLFYFISKYAFAPTFFLFLLSNLCHTFTMLTTATKTPKVCMLSATEYKKNQQQRQTHMQVPSSFSLN